MAAAQRYPAAPIIKIAEGEGKLRETEIEIGETGGKYSQFSLTIGQEQGKRDPGGPKTGPGAKKR